MNRSASPYRAPSPYGAPTDPAGAYPQYMPPGGVAQVGPGSVTYTSSTGPDGSIVYHSYKAVAASYQTPSGVVNGIQWIPAGSTTAPPAGAQPMPPEYAATWGKAASSSTSDWGRPDDKRRKHDDKDPKRHRNDDYELQKAREKDAQSMTRERRKSFSASSAGAPQPGGVQFPQAPGPYPVHPSVAASGYTGTAYGNPSAHGRAPSSAYGDLSRQFGDMGLDRNRDGERAERERKISTRADATGRPRGDTGGGRTSPYANTGSSAYPTNTGPYPSKPYPAFGTSPNVRPMDIPGGTSDANGYPGSSYSSSPSNRAGATTPYGSGAPQVYPKGHVLEGHPMPPGQVPSAHPRSRAPSPNPMGYSGSTIGKSPRAAPSTFPTEPIQQLPAPEAFSRPINAANTFANFETMKVDNLESICDPRLPKMPTVLSTHDIFPEDWKRCMQDLGRSWTGKLPVAPLDGGGHPPRPSTLAADLIDLWNVSFFNARGVELVLYKGRVKKTGSNVGSIEKRLPHYESPSETESSTEESDLSDYGKYVSGPYGRNPNALPEAIEARRRRAEARKEKRRRRKERRERRKARRYTVYLTCLPRPGAVPVPGPYGPPRGYPTHPYPGPVPPVPGGYPSTVPVGYGGY